MHLQERVEGELNKLMDQKLDKCSDRKFISSIVKVVQKYQTVELALDSIKINKFIHKIKYKVPNIDLLLDNIIQVVKLDKSKQALFSTLDLCYAYSQIPLDKVIRKQCNFSLIGGNATETYQFKTRFYGHTDMPAKFQKAINLILTNCTSIVAYLDDMLISGSTPSKVTISPEKTRQRKSCNINGQM